MIRLLVADDHRLLREGLTGLLAAEDDFAVVAEAGDGLEAVRLASEHKPDVAIVDVTMPGLSGIEAARAIRRDNPETKVLALSMHTENRFVTEMFRAGATGYVLKMADFEELAEAVRRVADGGSYVSADMAGEVVRNLAGLVPDAADPGGLSEREREVLQLLAAGKSAKECARILHVSVKTIDSHRRQIMQKLNLGSMAELIKYAIKNGLTCL